MLLFLFPEIQEEEGEVKYLGDLENHSHMIRGQVYSINDNKIFIKNFTYDGKGPDAFFWVGTEGSLPSENGILLPHPFSGKFYDYNDRDAPKLKKSDGNEPITLTLPDSVKTSELKWISVWCRRFKVNFADLILLQNGNNDLPRQ